MLFPTLALLAALAGDVRGETPFEAMRAAAADAGTLAAAGIDGKYVRYLSLHAIPPAERPLYFASSNYATNALNSQYQLIVPLTPVAGGVVARVNLKALGVSPQAWDQLLQVGSGPLPIPESYFSVQLVEEEEIGHYEDNYGRRCDQKAQGARWLKTGTRKVTRSNPQPGVTVADNGAAYLTLRTLTGTKTPIARADWFNVYALLAPAYYQLLGLDVQPGATFGAALKGANEDDWLKLVGANLTVEKTRIFDVANTRSVALHNRILDRLATPNTAGGGYVWKSIDSDQGILEQDYLSHFGDLFVVRKKANNGKLKFAAQEYFASLPNGLHAVAVTDNARGLLNVAAQSVATDTRTDCARRLADANVYVGVNRCIICHDKFGGGLWPIQAKLRKLSGPDSELLIGQIRKRWPGESCEDAGQLITNALGADLAGILTLDCSRYAVALAACCGRTVKENGTLFDEQTAAYLGASITIETASLETGVSVAELRALLLNARGLDPRLVGIAKADPEPMDRINWETSTYSQLLTLVATARPDLLLTREK